MATILVVDDEPRIRDVVQYALEREGYRVLCASDGAEALRRIADSAVALVVLYILMPEPDGLSVCRAPRRGSSSRRRAASPLAPRPRHRSSGPCRPG